MIVENKFDGLKFTEVSDTRLPDSREIIRNSVRAFHDLKEIPKFRIHDALISISGSLRSEKTSLSETIARETGTPVKVSGLEVERAAEIFEIAADEVRNSREANIQLSVLPSGQNRQAISKRMPLGPMLQILSYHNPLATVASKVAPAIACGNSVILKPSSIAPVTASRIAEICDLSGLPRKTVQTAITYGFGNVSRFLVGSRDVKIIAFSGNNENAIRIAAMGGLKKYIMEIFGNIPVIVWNDADLDSAAEHIVQAAFVSSLYSGHHIQRVFIHQEVYEYMKNRMIELTSRLRTGDPLNEETDVGPMISEEEAMKTENLISLTRELGGNVLAGGMRKNSVVEPTLIEGIETSSYVWNNDVTGPITMLTPVSSMSQAVNLANDCSPGFQAAIFTSDLNLSIYASEKLDYPTILVNDFPDYFPDAVPASGSGKNWTERRGVRYTMDEMCGMGEIIIKR